MSDNCTNCKYTVGKDGGSLTCQRHPSPVRVARSYWCGEWQEMPSAVAPKLRTKQETKKDFNSLFVDKQNDD
jgi:hypothetical protein